MGSDSKDKEPKRVLPRKQFRYLTEPSDNYLNLDLDVTNPTYEGEIFITERFGRPIIVKKVPTEKFKEVIDSEVEISTVIHHQRLATLTSVFQKGDNTFFAYKTPCCLPFSTSEPQKDQRLENHINFIIEFTKFLSCMHSKDILYLRENPCENIYLSPECDDFAIIGLDSCSWKEGPFRCSQLLKIDEKPSVGTDWLVLAIFINLLYTGKSGLSDDGVKPLVKDIEYVSDFLKKCCQKEQEKRDKFNPFKHKLIKKKLNISVDPTSVTIDNFGLDWSQGIKFSIGNASITINDTGLTFGSVMQGDESSITIDSNGLTMAALGYEMNLGGDGIHLYDETHTEILGLGEELMIALPGHKLTLGSEFRLQIGESCIALGNSIEVNVEGFSKKFEGANIAITHGSDEIIKAGKDGFLWDFLGDGFSLSLKGLTLSLFPFCIDITTSPIGLMFYYGETNSFGFFDGQFRFVLGGIDFTIGKNGVNIIGDGIKFTFDGKFDFKSDFVKFNWNEADIQLSSLNFTLPALPLPKPPNPPAINIGLPSLPSIPSLPKLNVSIGKKRDENAGKKLDECLQQDEEIEKEEEVIKLGILNKNKRKLIYTSKERFFYTDEDHVVKGAVAIDSHSHTSAKNQDLKISGSKDKFYFRFSNEEQRDEWQELFKDEISKK